MNYIAHLHLARVSDTSLLGNFLGDFVKGRDLSHLSDDHVLGVRLHRKVDQFTDQHPLVREVKSSFPSNLRRVAGIILDVYFDYLLVLNWSQYYATPVEHTFDEFYTDLLEYTTEISPGFAKTRLGLLKHRWLIDYKQEQTCFRAYTAIERRLNDKVKFAQDADVYIGSNKAVIQNGFYEFYPQLIEYTQSMALELKKQKETSWQ